MGRVTQMTRSCARRQSQSRLLQEPPPGMAFEISEAGIAAARIGARAELDFLPLKPGTLSVSPLKENVVDPDEFTMAVRGAGGHAGLAETQGCRSDPAGFLHAHCGAGFRQFPVRPKEQLSLVRFRVKRSVPFDVDSAALSYWAQPAQRQEGRRGGGDGAARDRGAVRSAVPRGGHDSGAGHDFRRSRRWNWPRRRGLSVLAKLTGRVLTVRGARQERR